MSGMDVLRERIARALHEDDLARFPESFEWESSATNREAYYSNADAVIVALGLVEWTSVGLGGQEFQHYAITWERIEEDGQ